MLKKLKDICKNLFHFYKSNRILILLFFLSTTFFLIQHWLVLSWDFSAYLINAKYFFQEGDYFEVYRAPLVSILLGIFLFFGRIAEYVYIIFVSGIFFVSVIRLSDATYERYLKKSFANKETVRMFFYLFLLTPFLLTYGLIEGTELLGLSLFQLFLAGILLNKTCGHYLGLAFLTRYNFMIFGFFILFNRDYKKILKNIITFLLTISPWLIYNRYKWGNFLASFIDSYYLNVLSRHGVVEPFSFLSLIQPIGYLLPFLILGCISIFFKKEWKNKASLLFLLTFIMLLLEVSNIPFKLARYMFNMITPIAFFSVIGMEQIIKRWPRKKDIFIGVFIFLFLISAILVITYDVEINKVNKVFHEAAIEIKSYGFENCKIVSNYWVPVNYYSGNVFYLNDLDYSIYLNESVLLFKGYITFDDTFNISDINKYNRLIDKENWVLLGKENLTNQTCAKKHSWDKPMTSEHCEIISNMFSWTGLNKNIGQLCLLVNER